MQNWKNPRFFSKSSKYLKTFKIVAKWVMEVIEGAKWVSWVHRIQNICFPADSGHIYGRISNHLYRPIRPENIFFGFCGPRRPILHPRSPPQLILRRFWADLNIGLFEQNYQNQKIWHFRFLKIFENFEKWVILYKSSNDLRIVAKWVVEASEGAKWVSRVQRIQKYISRPVPAIFPAGLTLLLLFLENYTDRSRPDRSI